MKNSLMFSFLSLTLLISQITYAGGDLVNNGGGLSEKTILFVYRNLGKYISVCLNAEGCKLSKSQKALLAKISATLEDEYRNSNQIQFLSENQNPGTFILDGEVKVAKTGSAIGSPIQINVDLLYQKNEFAVYTPLQLSEAVAILIHELGHHHGNHSHLELDYLGVKVASQLNQKIYTSPLLPWTQDILLTVINYNITDSFPDVFLTVGDDFMDLSALYRQTARCNVVTLPIPILPIPDLNILWRDAKASMLHNLHWTRFKEQKNTSSVTLELQANITKKCEDKNLINYLNTIHKLSLTLDITKVEGKWKVNTQNLQMRQIANPWWKLIQLPF